MVRYLHLYQLRSQPPCRSTAVGRDQSIIPGMEISTCTNNEILGWSYHSVLGMFQPNPHSHTYPSKCILGVRASHPLYPVTEICSAGSHLLAPAFLFSRWRRLSDPRRSAQSTPAATSSSSRCTAVARGHLARLRVAEMRRARNEAAARKADHKRALLLRRLARVSAASRTVASCLIANAAARRRERDLRARAAVAMVRRSE